MLLYVFVLVMGYAIGQVVTPAKLLEWSKQGVAWVWGLVFK